MLHIANEGRETIPHSALQRVALFRLLQCRFHFAELWLDGSAAIVEWDSASRFIGILQSARQNTANVALLLLLIDILEQGLLEVDDRVASVLVLNKISVEY